MIDFINFNEENFWENSEIIFDLDEEGTVLSNKDGIAVVGGLTNVQSGEMVLIGDIENRKEPSGVVLSLYKETVSVVLFDTTLSEIDAGARTVKTGLPMSIPLSAKIVGTALNALAYPMDERITFTSLCNESLMQKIDTKAIGIIPRESVREPMQTGVIAVDALTPIGCGQRELIIGDRQTGKTCLALDAIMAQLLYGSTFCIYVAIGQKRAAVAKVYDFFFNSDKYKDVSKHRFTLIAATASEAAVLQFLAPYTGCTIGEWLAKKGGYALVVYDDLSKQAVAYRQMSLLLRRPPGREAYPGDVFYLHSRLLERAAKLSVKMGGGSLTALPIIETQAGDVSAYIPTNVISITDGQIFLETKLFNEGVRPAINVGISVSRIGSSAQTKGMKQVAGTIKLELAQYREVESFASFASELDPITRKVLHRGVRLITVIKQLNKKVLDVETQVLLLFGAVNGYLDHIEDRLLEKFKRFLLYFFVESNIMDNFGVEQNLDMDYLNMAYRDITKDENEF